MTDIRQLLPTPKTTGRRELTILAGYVSRNRPAPVLKTDPVWVIVPSHSSDAPYGPLTWPVSYGNTLPTAGTPVTIGIDDQGTPRIIGWEGVYS